MLAGVDTMSAERIRLINKFGSCARCALIAFGCFMGSILLSISALLFSENVIYRISSLVLVLCLAALTATHLVAWVMKKNMAPAPRPHRRGGCGCNPEPTS